MSYRALAPRERRPYSAPKLTELHASRVPLSAHLQFAFQARELETVRPTRWQALRRWLGF